MSKRNGEPYDPSLRKTEHGSKLYTTWVRIVSYPHIESWGYFPTFYEWAMQSGYEIGAWLRRIDTKGPYSPDNCVWYTPQEEKEYIPQEWADGWNKAVNRIRKHYGMPPLRGTTYVD